MPPADRGGSTSVRGRIRSPHSSGGLAQRLGQVGQTDGQTDGRIAVSLNAPAHRRGHNNRIRCSKKLEGKYSLESTDPRESKIRAHLRP